MIDPSSSPYFERQESPDGGFAWYLLSADLAPLQQGFYFVNDCTDKTGRWLWFYCGWPPTGNARHGRCLGVIDFATDDAWVMPETGFVEASPFICPETGAAFWTSGDSVFSRLPERNAEPVLVGSLPSELVGLSTVSRLATHLTRSADGSEFFLDAKIGTHHVFGSLRISDGHYTHWHTFARNHNHAQFSPIDSGLVLFAQEFHVDQHVGKRIAVDDRLQMIRRGGAPRPILPEPAVCTHEWWAPGGRHVYAVKGGFGVWRVDIATGEREEIPFAAQWHVHCSSDERYLVGDAHEGHFFRGCGSQLYFLHRETGRTVKFLSNPPLDSRTGRSYHIDPHPRFVAGDRWVVFTAIVDGRICLGMIETAQLIDATS